MGAVVAYEADRSARPQPSAGGVEYIPVSHRGRGGLRFPIGLGQVLAPGDVLVLHSAWTSHNLAASEVAQRLGIPYVLEPRGAYDPHIVARRRLAKSAWWALAEKRMVERSAAVHIFFDSEKAHLLELGYQGPTVTAPNGVDVPEGHRWDGGSGGYLMWLGRFDPDHKGLALLLQAMLGMPRSLRPELRLYGPDWRGKKDGVARMVASLGLGRHVRVERPLLGDEKYETMARARAFVYPSRWEAFGNSVAEAAAVGVPVLTTRYPLGSYLQSRSAAVAKDHDPESLAEGIGQVLQPAAAEMGARAREIATSEFRWDHVVQTWTEQVGALI